VVDGHTEHRVTPLELFFDLVFVFGLTQVTSMLGDDPSWRGVLHGLLILAALWWAWTGYAWLTSSVDVDEGGVRIAMLAATTAMLGVALAVPGAFGDDALLFGCAYLAVRILHLALYSRVARGDEALRRALRRHAASDLLGAVLLLAAALVEGDARLAVWVVALAVSYVAPAFASLSGWWIAPEHFAERHGLIVLIALGESIIALGVGAGFELVPGVLLACALGMVVVSSLWWLYFDVAAIFLRTRLTSATGAEQVRMALHAFSFLHLPMIGGIILFALGLKTTLSDVGEALEPVPAIALCGGAAVYLLAHVGALWRATGRVFRRRTIGGLILLALIPVALEVPSLAALALVAAVCAGVVAYEAILHREHRVQVRHPEAVETPS
jgi:low temperature requirement protein LtrA